MIPETASRRQGAPPANGSRPPARRRFLLLWVLPPALVVAVAVAPLVSGERTLFLRDVFNTHLGMRIAEARALAEGYLPLVDPWRAGGQPLLGNPNAVAAYPTALLLLVASPTWSLNAHFWLHLLLAPWALFWLARAWGLGRAPAWVAGVCYLASGYFLSTLNLLNLVAGAVWAPALAAAALDLAAGRRPRRSTAALALVWALLLLAGDPMTAAMALALALSAVAVRGRTAAAAGAPATLAAAGRRAALALGLGSLVAAPQLVEFLRILPLSFRGYWRYSERAATAASWNPATIVEWLLPWPLGRPDLSFWGAEVHGAALPLLLSLTPGALALALAAAAGRPRGGADRWAWGWVAAGIFLALGRHNPAVGWLLETAGFGLLRLPVKFWLWVAVGGALLCGLGFERLRASAPARRRFALALAGLAAVYAALWVLLALAPEAAFGVLRGLVPERFPDAFVDAERRRLAGSCLLALAIVALLGGAARLGRRRAAALALLPLVHLASQLALLRPLLASDDSAVYRRPPAVLDLVPAAVPYVQGDAGGLFGPAAIPYAAFPDASLRWLARQSHDELHPHAGARFGRRADLALSPEGLDSFLTRAAVQAVRGLDDPRRLRLLAASGVGTLLLRRPLAPAAESQVELAGFRPSWGGTLRVYRIRGHAEAVYFAGRVRRSAHLNETLAQLLDPAFDPRLEVVLPGPGESLDGPGGAVEILAEGPESLEVAVEAPAAGALVVQRSHLPLWRAEVDGRPVPVTVANLHRMAVELPPGDHRVRLWVDRRPLRAAGAASALALALLGWLARGRGGRRAPAAAGGGPKDGGALGRRPGGGAGAAA